ncbi:MAG: HDOD domain-containing protein [Thermodesulfobacteriota bacterium]
MNKNGGGEKSGANPGPVKRPLCFEGLEDKELGALYSRAAIKRLKRGEHLIREGEEDQTAYVILDGVIGVYKDLGGGVEEIAVLGEGDWLGEIAFTRRIKRTASAQAKTPSSVMAIDQTTLEALEPKTQLFFYRTLNDLAAQRVAELSARETELAGRNQQLIEYISSSRSKERQDYGASEMIRGIVAKVPRLPAFAADMAAKLLGEDVTPAEVAEMVKEDPALSALVLKTVNSPYYGFSKMVSDIHHAVVLLGFNEIYQLVLAEGVRRTMPAAPVFRDLHTHSVAMSHLAFALAQSAGTGKPAEAATIALLHDIGLCVIQLLKDKNPRLAPLIEALDSAQLGALLLRTWNLPEEVCRTVEYRFHPEFAPPDRVPAAVRTNTALLYLAHLAHDVLKGVPEKDLPRTFLSDYARVVGWELDSAEAMIQLKLLPVLGKKINTVPAAFRRLLAPRLQSGPKKA